MSFDFDLEVNRLQTASMKWDQVEPLFGSPDVLPMWVADMDFPSPPAVREALVERAKHGIYGYTSRSQTYYDAVMGWLKRRHCWETKQEWIATCPGTVTSIAILLQMLTEPGDGVIVQTPVYHAFFHVIQRNERTVVENPLLFRDGRYEMDYEDLERKLAAGAKIMLLCSPHNPCGRVWKKEELQKVGELCGKYNVPVISDEIHFDLVYEGHTHTMFGSISEEFAQNSITVFATTKTFNTAGLQASSLVIPNPKWKRMYNQRLNALSLGLENYFGLAAVEAAYTHGDEWLDALLVYLKGNLEYVNEYVQANMSKIKVIQPEGTYLVWLDCRELGMSSQQAKDWMYKEAKVALSEGSQFGQNGEGFLRMNIACPRSILHEGLQRMHQALQKRD